MLRRSARSTASVARPDDALMSGQRVPVTASLPAKFRALARRDAAAFYLSQLAKGVLAGEVTVASGDDRVVLATSEFLYLEVEVKQKKRANHVGIKLRWPKRPLIRVATRGASHVT